MNTLMNKAQIGFKNKHGNYSGARWGGMKKMTDHTSSHNKPVSFPEMKCILCVNLFQPCKHH